MDNESKKVMRSIYNMNPTITDDMNRWFEVECQTMMVSGPIWLITQVQAAHGNHGNNQEHKYCLTRYSQYGDHEPKFMVGRNWC